MRTFTAVGLVYHQGHAYAPAIGQPCFTYNGAGSIKANLMVPAGIATLAAMKSVGVEKDAGAFAVLIAWLAAINTVTVGAHLAPGALSVTGATVKRIARKIHTRSTAVG